MKKPKYKSSTTLYKLTIHFLRQLLKDRVAKRIELKGTNHDAERIVVRQITAIHQLINELREDENSHPIQRNLSPYNGDNMICWWIDKYKELVEDMIKNYRLYAEVI